MASATPVLLFLCLFSLQSPASEASSSKIDLRCGSHSLYIALQALGLAPSVYEELEAELGPPESRGYSMDKLEQVAKKRGASTLAVRTTLENLAERARPFVCLTLVEPGHYALLYDLDESSVHVIDYPKRYSLNRDAFLGSWTREALLIGTSPMQTEESIATARLWRQVITVALILAAGTILVLVVYLAIGRRFFRTRRTSALSLFFAVGQALCFGGCQRPANDQAPTNRPTRVPDERDSGGLVVVGGLQDLGVVRVFGSNKTIEAHTPIRNAGKHPVQVKRIVANCVCTDGLLEKTRIGPGECVDLRTTIRPGTSREVRSSRLDLVTDDTMHPVVSVQFQWHVQTALYTSEAALNIATVRPKQEARATVPVYISGIGLCERCEVRAAGDERYVALAVAPKGLGAGTCHDHGAMDRKDVVAAELEIRILPQGDADFYKQLITLTIECGGANRAESQLPLSWTVSPIISIASARLSLGTAKRGERLRGAALLHSNDGRPFRILGVRAESEELGIFVTADKTDAFHKLEVSLDAPEKDGPWRSSVEIRTDHPEAPSLVLPVSAFLRSGRPV